MGAFPVQATAEKPYSSDENCLHISYEAGRLEDLQTNGVELVDFGMSVSPQEAPDEMEKVTIAFESGVPVAVNGNAPGALGIVLGICTYKTKSILPACIIHSALDMVIEWGNIT